jgi:YfiH family protein
MADERTGAVAAVHAGWRGLVAGAPTEGLRLLTREFGVRPADIVVAIGPSIGPCCYEVGSEVRDRFDDAWGPASVRWFERGPEKGLFLDLWRAAADQLADAAILPERIHVAQLCTAHHLELFHSYRAEGPRTGRLAGVIRARRSLETTEGAGT